MQLHFRRAVGATLVEIIMVVAIIAVFTIGALAYFNTASQGSKVQEALSGLDTISTVIQNQFATSPNYLGLTEMMVVNSGGIQANLKSTTAGHLKNPWSADAAAVTIGVNPAAVPAASSFLITYTLIPQGACVDLVSKAFNRFPSIKINSTTVLNAGTAATACVSPTNTLVFTSN
jgi:type II secretory pathway pseudopilin PulG